MMSHQPPQPYERFRSEHSVQQQIALIIRLVMITNEQRWLKPKL
jgi:hypothetical protein